MARVVRLDVAEYRRLWRWAVKDKFFSTGIRWLHHNVFRRPHAYHVRLAAPPATGGGAALAHTVPSAPDEAAADSAFYYMRYHNEERFKVAIERLLTDALPYLHLGPVVVLRVRRDLGAWLTDWLVRTPASAAGARDSIALPVQVQPLTEADGDLVFIDDPLTGVREYQWRPHDERLDQVWAYLVYVHDTATCSLYPATVDLGDGDGEEDADEEAEAEAAATSRRVLWATGAPSLGAAGAATRRRDRRWPTTASTPTVRVRSPFRNVKLIGTRGHELARNFMNAEHQRAYPIRWVLRKPLTEMLPSMPSQEALARTDTVTGAARFDALGAEAETIAFAAAIVDRSIDRNAETGARPFLDAMRAQSGLGPLTRGADGGLVRVAPQDVARARYARPEPTDSVLVLPELVSDVRELEASTTADLAAWDDMYAQHVARAFGGGMPVDVLRGGADLSSPVASRSKAASEAMTAHLYKAHDEVLARERHVLNALFQFVYRHALAQLDLQLALAVVDEFEHAESVEQMARVLAPGRATELSMADRRRVLAGALDGGGAAALTKAELKDLIVQRLVKHDYLHASLVFDEEIEARARDQLLRDVERLPPETQEARRAEFDLLVKGAVAGIVAPEDVAKQADALLGIALPATRKRAKELKVVDDANAQLAVATANEAEANAKTAGKVAAAPLAEPAGAATKRKADTKPAKGAAPAKRARKD